jgi:ArsR family transcriptional regulator, arsenate/arsenite/antimonite-responsive transcriptional repressor
MDLGVISNERKRVSFHERQGLLKVRREGTFLWYSANTQALQDLLAFLYAECCTRNKAIAPQAIVCCS